MNKEDPNLVEDEARRLVEAAEGTPFVDEVSIKSLGKAQKFLHSEESPLAGDIGWKNLPLANMP